MSFRPARPLKFGNFQKLLRYIVLIIKSIQKIKIISRLSASFSEKTVPGKHIINFFGLITLQICQTVCCNKFQKQIFYI